MESLIKRLILLYMIIVLVKTIFSYFIPSPSAFNDSYIFMKAAREIFYYGSFSVHGVPITTDPPLYSLILSLAYFFKDIDIIYPLIKFFNVILSSLIIFPIFLLAREFISKKKALLCSLLVSLVPSFFAFSGYIMPENLFYSLFMFSIYFIYKSFTTKEYKWSILSGLFIALSLLTKYNAVVFIPVIAICFFIKIFKSPNKKHELKKLILLIIVFLLVISPWITKLSSSTDYRTYGMGTVASFLLWFIMYIGFIALASGIFFFVMNLIAFKNIKEEKFKFYLILSLLTIIFVIILAINHNLLSPLKYESFFSWLGGRPVGRYIDMILPLIFINGFIGFDFYKKKKRIIKPMIITSIILLLSLQLIFFPLFPVNNLSVTWLGILNEIVNYFNLNNILFYILFILIITFLIIFLHIKNKLTMKNMMIFFTIFFLLTSISCFAINYYDSKKFWYEGEQMQLALEFSKEDKKISNILFDERDCTEMITKLNQTGICEKAGKFTIMGVWLNDNIRIGNVNNLNGVDYVISRHELNLTKIKESKSGIKIYSTS